MKIDEIIQQAQLECFDNGNFVEAEKLFLEAANEGSGRAAHELGIMYITGGPGLKPNHEKSQYWLERSLDLGFEKTIATDPEWFRKGAN